MTDMEADMKLKQIGEKTYYIENDTNIGIYMTGPDRVCLIDTGSKGDGEKIDDILAEQGWSLDFIINTHCHIDHVGGNKYLMEKYNVPAYCTDVDKTFAEYTDLESAYMNGGRPASKLRHIFAHPGKIGFKDIEDVDLPGIEWMMLPGHSFGMIGVKTSDGIWFLGDTYLSEAYLQKRSFGYLIDVEKYMETLELLKSFEANIFVPSHGIAEKNIEDILDLNIKNQNDLIDAVKCVCSSEEDDFMGIGLDEILKKMYDVTKMRVNETNHALLSSTVKCYLTLLQDRGDLECGFADNVMVWKSVK